MSGILLKVRAVPGKNFVVLSEKSGQKLLIVSCNVLHICFRMVFSSIYNFIIMKSSCHMLIIDNNIIVLFSMITGITWAGVPQILNLNLRVDGLEKLGFWLPVSDPLSHPI